MSSGHVASAFKPGDVLRYQPDERHCREGMAIINDSGRALDTFWWYSGDEHLLTSNELATAELEFNLNDYNQADGSTRHIQKGKWEKYAPSDRGLITSQHGLQPHYYVRKGAVEDWATQINNARQKVDDAVAMAKSAQRQVGYAREDLERVIAAASEAVIQSVRLDEPVQP